MMMNRQLVGSILFFVGGAILFGSGLREIPQDVTRMGVGLLLVIISLAHYNRYRTTTSRTPP